MPTNNVLNNLIFSPNGAVLLPGAKFISTFRAGLAVATTDIYTVPTGRRAVIFPSYGANTSSTPASFVQQAFIKVSGTYYAIGTQGTNSMNQLILNPSAPIVLEAGESISVTVSTGTTSNTFGFPVIEFDNSSTFKTAKLLTMISGNNTIYTCPANTKAFILDQSCNVASGTGLAQFYYSNFSGGSVTRRWNHVNSAGSVAPSTAVTASTSISTGTIDIAGTNSSCLNATDYISLTTNSATATQMAWVNLMESPA